ncbi:insulinase family protein [Treponema sp.]|uniref:insulinase family protein n=1 Tax=Treponema sp. TaxID=166 RepID=UPI003EFF49C8
MKKNDLYKGFEVLDVFDIDYFDSKGIFLRHRNSGLEVFHVLNQDEENLFAFAFRTPCRDSTGAAHIVEHSVLCGSRKFPMKDPFLQLKKQSINTYLNAYTARDRTVFPASSLIRQDYFNLMSVYADAVFFPSLSEEVFLQEGWRLELDNEGSPAIQGVVYNEMKGSYSSFNSVVSDAVFNASVAGTYYENDSGGDPLQIPLLSYEQFREFHKKYYCAANCLVFLYGNIPTEEQLDFLDENVLKNIKSPGKKILFESEILPVKMKRRLELSGPAQGTDSATAVVWNIGDSAEKKNSDFLPMEIRFLTELLLGNDSAPVSKFLLNKFKGCDISPQSGCDTSSRFFAIAIGMSGLKTSQAEEFRISLLDFLESLAENGVEKDELERSFMGFDFSMREVKRSPTHGPYSIVLLKRLLCCWTYGKPLGDAFSYIDIIEGIKAKCEAEPDYIKNLIRKFLVENKKQTLVTVSPSEDWSSARNEKEKKLAAGLYRKIGKKSVLLALEKLRAFQNASENELIPAVQPSELKNPAERIMTRKTMCSGLPLYINRESCNGIVYASVLFPVDRLAPEDYKFLPLFTSCILGLGAGNRTWEETVSLASKILGGFSANIQTASVPACAKKIADENPLIVGRDWLVLRFKFIEEKSSEVFNFAREIITSLDFSDTARIKTILNGLCTALNDAVVPGGHYFSQVRACCLLNHACAVSEIKGGITSVFAFSEIKKMKLADISKKLESMYKTVVSSGALLHVTAGKTGIAAAKKGFAALAEQCALVFPKPKRKVSDRRFFMQTELPGKICCMKNPVADEVFVVPGNTGFASAAVASSENTKMVMADTVFTHLLENSDLWKQVRMSGGAYGVFLSVRSSSGITTFTTYRDPNPLDSLKYFSDRLSRLEKTDFTLDDIKKAVSGVYSGEIDPYTPEGRGASGLMRCLYGISLSLDRSRISSLLGLAQRDIEKSLCRYKKASFRGKKVVICGKEMISDKIKKISGKIIKLPL